MKVGGFLWNLHRLKTRLKCTLSGEIYFHKYEPGIAYHWQHYYERKTPFYVSMVQTVKDLVPAHSRVLDLGCGDGLIANVLSQERECVVFGIDSNPLAISLARRNNRNNNRFFVRSVYGRYPAGEFDAVVAIEIFEHLKKPEVLLKRARSVLNENGVFIVTTPLKEDTKPISKLHVEEYRKEEFHKYVEEYFTPEKSEVLIDPRDERNRCYILCCRKNMK